jgi:two-component system, chemotaxis family, chemotaxis protein CheY
MLEKNREKILIVDDMAWARSILENFLQELGYSEFGQAGNGQEAFDQLNDANNQGKPFNLVISDWAMPLCSGLDLLKNMRHNPNFRNIPFLMVSAKVTRNQMEVEVKSGKNEILTKPVDFDSLKEKLDFLLSKA